MARTQSFRAFLELAVVKRKLPTYEKFFDAGGPAWATTRLLDFSSLDAAFAQVRHEFAIPGVAKIERHNAAPARLRDFQSYADEAGSLLFETRRYYRWYYEEAQSLLLTGQRAATLRAA